MPEDIAITSSKSDVDPCSHSGETDRQKSVDGRTDRQTAFQLYIVDIYIIGNYEGCYMRIANF